MGESPTFAPGEIFYLLLHHFPIQFQYIYKNFYNTLYYNVFLDENIWMFAIESSTSSANAETASMTDDC